MTQDRTYAQFTGGPVDGKRLPFIGKLRPVKKLRLWLSPGNVKVYYKRTTRRGNTHYYTYLYTHREEYKA